MRRAACILLLALAWTSGCWQRSKSSSGDPPATDTDTDGDSGSDPVAEPGELLWAVRAGGSSPDRAIGLDSLPDGSCIVVGSIGGTAVFGPGEENETSLSTGGFGDGFAARLGHEGELTWVASLGGDGSERALDVVGLDDGSAAVVGDFEGSLDIENGSYEGDTVSGAGGVDGFVAVFDHDGIPTWVEAVGGPGDDSVAAIDAAGGTGLRVIGPFSETVVLGEDGPNEISVTATGNDDVLIAAFDEGGGFEWAEAVQVIDCAWSVLGNYDASVSPDGSAVFSGSWSSPATFAPGEPEETSFTEGMIMIARYDAEGTLDWALSDGIEDGYSMDYPHECTGITHSADGGVFFTCRRYVNTFWDLTMEFGVDQEDQLIVQGIDGYDALLGHYGPGGTLGWVIDEGGVNSDGASGVDVLDDGSVAIAGYHGANATFGIGGDNETTLETDAFAQVRALVAEYDSEGQLIWASTAGGGNETAATAISRAADGGILVAGYFNGTAVFGQGEPHETTLESAGGFDVFVAKYAP
jgi:hypothetical protein